MNTSQGMMTGLMIRWMKMKVRGLFCLMNKIVFEINGSLIKALKQGHTKEQDREFAGGIQVKRRALILRKKVPLHFNGCVYIQFYHQRMSLLYKALFEI